MQHLKSDCEPVSSDTFATRKTAGKGQAQRLGEKIKVPGSAECVNNPSLARQRISMITANKYKYCETVKPPAIH